MTLTGPRGSYDALLLVSFGGPEGPDDVVPFLENVTRGRGHPARAARRGRRALHALRRGLARSTRRTARCSPRCASRPRRARPRPPGLLGQPQLGTRTSPTRCARCAPTASRRALCFVTCAVRVVLRLPSVPREPRRRARGRGRRLGGRHGSTSCGTTSTTPASSSRCVDATARGARPAAGGRTAQRAWSSPPTRSRSRSPTTSGPDGGGAYVAQHRAVARLRRRRRSRRGPASRPAWDLVFQSRSGRAGTAVARAGHQRPPRRAARTRRAAGRSWSPIGFVSDHIEVVWDLDTVAMDRARELGLPAARAGDRGHGSAVRRDGARAGPRARSAGAGPGPARRSGPSYDVCPAGCCANPRGRPRSAARLSRGHGGPICRRRPWAHASAGSSADLATTLAARRAARGRGRRGARGRGLAHDGQREGVTGRGHEVDATDVVTEMDRRARRCSSTASSRPVRTTAILGEEGADHVGETGIRWVLDPIDGTVNYLYGLPGWAVSRRRRDRRAAPSSASSRRRRCGRRSSPSRAVARSCTTSTASAGCTSTTCGAARGPGRHRLRLHRRAPGRPGPGGRAGPAAGARHPARAERAASTCARSPRGGSTPTTSAGRTRGTSPPAAWSPPRQAPASTGCAARRPARS